MKIVFYDGYCPMCNAWVRRILRWDRKRIFHFAPLDSDTAKKLLTPFYPGYLKEDTIVLFEDGRVSLRSTAALRIAMHLRFPLILGGVGWLIPLNLRDWIYKWIASRRYRYGERYKTCPLPPPEWRDRFL